MPVGYTLQSAAEHASEVQCLYSDNTVDLSLVNAARAYSGALHLSPHLPLGGGPHLPAGGGKMFALIFNINLILIFKI